MLNKTQHEEPNTIIRGDNMKCSFCENEFEQVADEDICENCMHSVDELTDGKGDDENE